MTQNTKGSTHDTLRQKVSSLSWRWTTGITGALNKDLFIRIRWPFVIMCSYLMIYSRAGWVAPVGLHVLLFFYLMSNAVLYFVDAKLLVAPYFYGPVLFLDTLFMTISIALSSYMSADFYLACFSTIVLCCICSDFRALVVITILAPVLYGAYLVQSSQLSDPAGFLRLPFPFVIALFYGYFAQVERSEKALKVKAEQEARRRRAAEQIQHHRECQSALYEISLAITSTLDLHTVLDLLLEKIGALLPFIAASNVKLYGAKRARLRTVTSRHKAGNEWKSEEWDSDRDLAAVVADTKSPLLVANARTDPRTHNISLFRAHGFVSYLGVPLSAKGTALGVLGLFFEREHQFTAEEIEILSTLSGQAAVAIQNAQLYDSAVKKALELGKSNQVKDELLGVVSHELRTPLNVILGYGGMMEQRMFGDINTEQEKALQKINKQSSDMLEMMSGIMEATKAEAGAMVPEISEVAFGDLLAEIRAVYSVPSNKGVAILWDYPSDLPLAKTDRRKLRHMLQNLINNALKFTERGSVTLSARYLKKTASVAFKVTDTGIGIPKESLPKIFGMYRQADVSEGVKNDGVGLGLYIVKKFADLIGASIEVESEVGKGSTFTVTVPLGVAAQPEDKPGSMHAAV